LTSHELWHFFSGCSLKVAVLLSGGGLRFVIFGSKINQGNVCQFHAEKGDCIAVVSCS
jgi:predicted cupin superfamily sugar epimerase